MKPDVVLFGEPIPEGVREASEEEARNARVLLVIGTSATVYPAGEIPRIAGRSGAAVIEINPEETHLTGGVSHLRIPATASRGMTGLLGEIRALGTECGTAR